MNISFDQIWKKAIRPLEGKTICTLDEGKPNEILKVTNESLTRDSENDSPSQTIPREIFEAVYNYIMVNGTISREYINEELPKRYSSIVCAVLAKAPNIAYELRPVRFYKKIK
ncbi:hypothetical protein [Sphingobacterium gobiense]|uniref:Uncharacterized protein n=1 Tax=Sphingobacterium gobiense TaxID=1382456 RepID=A0A2S9JSB7_9SPHI|nr:hypothetical protein [Sphingobacterium gobiense]PRD56031.1 hypothetical protein C5749_01705 [Sphingobacterium gobiense]